MSKILDGRVVRDGIRTRLKSVVGKRGKKPGLAIIQVGDKAESNLYIKRKVEFGRSIGVPVRHLRYPTNISSEKLIGEIRKLNNDQRVRGIVIQQPLPPRLNTKKIIGAINITKDIDDATSRGVVTLLQYYKIPLAGKHAVVVGRSELVGKPIARALLNQNATVTVCHSKTKNLASITKSADILIVAVGKPRLITRKHVSPGQVIVDVGITVVNKKLVGDVNFQAVAPLVCAISPVPGGVGPLTVASLFQNLLGN